MKQRGIDYGIFGDIFLEDLKRYREEKLAEVKIDPVFPLWNMPSGKVFTEFTSLGYKSVIVCVDETKLGKEFLGRVLDAQLLRDLPSNVDCCGENGEFHTFTYAGPLFRNEVRFTKGDTVYKTYKSPQGEAGFYFLDLIPV